MTDRELLEAAALTAELTVHWDDEGKAWKKWPSVRWNPLTDDGDALRLAVKLHMTVRCYMGTTVAQIGTPGQRNAYEEATDRADPAAATRRAIVRAAAFVAAPELVLPNVAIKRGPTA